MLKNKEKSPQEPRSNNKKDICNPVKIQHTKDRIKLKVKARVPKTFNCMIKLSYNIILQGTF